MPDEVIKPQTISNESIRVQQKLVNPVFAFSLDLAYGKIPGFDPFKVDKPIKYDYDIKTKDFEITDNVYQAFKNYAVQKYKVPANQIDKEKEFVIRTLRSELVTAAYGSQTSFQVFNEYDNQLLRAIELLPQAKQLAIEAQKAKKLNSSVTNR
jgi:hypothetical protein